MNMEKVIIELYKEKNDIEIAKIIGISERSVQRLVAKLRLSGKLPYRKDLVVKQDLGINPTDLTDEAYNDILTKSRIAWQVPKSNVELEKKEFKSYLVIADTHVPSQNIPAVRSVLSLCNDIKFDGFIIDGDFMDLNCISHWTKNKRKTLEMKRLKSDYIQGNILLDEFDVRLPKLCDKRFIYGNHERFMDDLIEERPELEGLFEPKECLKLEERGYKVFTEQNHAEKVGRLHITHGVWSGTSPVRAALAAYKTNVLFGHVHTEEERLESAAPKELAIIGASMGALSDLNPAYMQNKTHRWSHGFAIVHVFPNGFFHLELIRIVNAKFIYNMTVYDGARK